MLASPSIQLGTLAAVLEGANIPTREHSFHLAFQQFLERQVSGARFDMDDYGAVCTEWENYGVGDWIFAVSEVRGSIGSKDAEFERLVRNGGMSAKLLRRLRKVREAVPDFLEQCAQELLADGARVVGFTNVYSQTWPTVALARTLKRKDPDVLVVMGGTSCDGDMGPALMKAFPQLDYVMRGRAEPLVVELMQQLLSGEPPIDLPGLCRRVNGEVRATPVQLDLELPMDELPIPRYSEYFDRLGRSPLAHRILPQIPIESARGCWWGAVSHCTFCGLNGEDMRFRSKSAERVLDEIEAQARNHHVLDFISVDNIIDLAYFKNLMPQLEERGHDLSFFFETKANLKEHQVKAFVGAGVRAIQPGIESLSTPILRLMKKGVTTLQNIRLLKWCATHGVRVVWNLIYGFPGEPPEEYERMARLFPSLVHLEPPRLSRLGVYRFSPYFNRPADYGLRLQGPTPYYRLLYDVDAATLEELAQNFEYTYADEEQVLESYVHPMRDAAQQWRHSWERDRCALTYRRGPDFLIVTDTRSSVEAARYTLGEAEAQVFLALNDGPTFDALRRGAGAALGEKELERLLADLVEARLVYAEDGRFLSLAIPESARVHSAARTA